LIVKVHALADVVDFPVEKVCVVVEFFEELKIFKLFYFYIF